MTKDKKYMLAINTEYISRKDQVTQHMYVVNKGVSIAYSIDNPDS